MKTVVKYTSVVTFQMLEYSFIWSPLDSNWVGVRFSPEQINIGVGWTPTRTRFNTSTCFEIPRRLGSSQFS